MIEDYNVNAYTVLAETGVMSPFHIFIGTPQPDEFGVPTCKGFCPLLKNAKHIHGETDQQAFFLGHRFIIRLIRSAEIRLVNEDGTQFQFPNLEYKTLEGNTLTLCQR